MAIRQPSRSGCPSPTRRCGDGDLGPRVEPLGSREGTGQLGCWRITGGLHERTIAVHTVLSRSATARQRVSSFTSITTVGWINAHQPLDLVPGRAVHLAASTGSVFLRLQFFCLIRVFKAALAHVLQRTSCHFLSSVPGIAFCPSSGACAGACIGLARCSPSRPWISATLISAAMHRA